MTTLKQQLAIGGQAISNLDKDMVITLDAHPSVQIDTIQEDSITYKFLGDITQDTTYTLNLTFVYKKLHKLVMPVTLSHVVNDPSIQISWPTKSVKVWDEGSWDDIPFTVMFLGTDPAEDITASITNLVMVSNEYITITDNTKWRITNGDKTQAVNTNLNFTFDVEHNGTVYHCKGQVIFNIAKYDGIDYKVELVGTAEGTVNTPSKLYFKPTYQGRFSPGTKISPITDSNIRVTINSQEDDLEKELMVVTITGTTVNDAIYNRFIFYKDGITGNGSTNFIMWFYIKIWAKAITVTGAPSRTDTKYYQVYKFPITQIRLGHEIVTPQDPRLVITGTGLSVRPILGFDVDGIWIQNLYETVGGFTNTTTVIRSTGYAEWSGITASYTTEVGENLTLVPIQTTPIVPSTHNDISILVRRIETEEEVPGLTLVGKPSITPNGPKALIKYYDDIAISDTPAVGTLTLSADLGHTGTGMKVSGVFKTPDGDILGLRDAQIDIPQSPMIATSASTVDVSKIAPVPVQFTLKQLQFDNVLTDITTATFSAMTATGEATAVGEITNKGNGLYEALITPTAVTGSATITGTITVNESGVNVNYPVSFDTQFNRISDVVYTDQPLNVQVFQEGADIPFRITVEGTDVTSQMTDVVITPTTNVITSGGLNWEIWTAPTAGVAEKITYTFKVPGWDGELEEYTYVATFNIAPWDGKMLKITALDSIIGGSTVKDTSFSLSATYRGKPAADKIELVTFGTMDEYASLVSIIPSEDNASATVNIRAKTTNASPNKGGVPLSVSGMQFKLKDTVGDKPNENLVTWTGTVLGFFNGDYLAMYGVGWCYVGQTGEVTYMREINKVTRSVVYAFVNGERIPLSDILFWSTTGTSSSGSNALAYEYLYGIGTDVYAQVNPSAGYNSTEYHNPIRARLKSDPSYIWSPSGTDANFWVYTNSGARLADTVIDVTTGIDPSDDRDVQVGLKQGTRTLTDPSIYVSDIIGSPSNGNVIIPGSTWEAGKSTTNPDKLRVKFAAGHTGESIRLDGSVLDSGMSGKMSRLNVIINVGKAPVTFTPTQTDIPAVGGQHVDIEFTLSMLHYKQAPADLSGITFKSISVVGGAEANGDVVHVEGNTFKIPVIVNTSFGTVAISGVFTEPNSTIEFNFTGNVTTVNNSNTHVVGISPFNVSMFERDSRLPFTVNDASGDITNTVKDVTIVPNEYVITHGGSEWEIWTGPKEGGTTKVTYNFTVTSNGVDELVTYEATFTLPVWDGVMFKIAYNYDEAGKDYILAQMPQVLGGDEYTVYPLYRNQPAPEMVQIGSFTSGTANVALPSPGLSADGKGLLLKPYAGSGLSPTYNDAGLIKYVLKPEYLNGQTNNIEGVTLVTHTVKLRTYRKDAITLYNLASKSSADYPKVGVNSAFTLPVEVRKDKVKIPANTAGIKYNFTAGQTSLFMRVGGVDENNLYVICSSGPAGAQATNNINVTLGGVSSVYVSVYANLSTANNPLTWYSLNILPDQVLLPNGVRQLKFTIVEQGKTTVLKDKVIKGLMPLIVPSTAVWGNAVYETPIQSTPVMDADGVWTMDVKTGWTGDSFTLEGVIANASAPDVVLACRDGASPVPALVTKVKGIGKLVGDRFEVKGENKTYLQFTLDVPHYDGTVPANGATFRSISVTGAATTTSTNAQLVSGNTWQVLCSLVEDGGIVKVSGTFTEVGNNNITYEMAEFECTIVDTSTVVFTPTYPKVDVFSGNSSLPFTIEDDTGPLTATSWICKGSDKILGNGWNWRILAVDEAGERVKCLWSINVTSHGVSETHTVEGGFDVNPWDGVQYSFDIAGTAPYRMTLGLGKSGQFTLRNFKFDYTAPSTAGTQWKTNKDKLLANTDGCLTWLSDSNPSPANNPTVAFTATKVGKISGALLPIDYVGPGYDRWPAGTINKNFAERPFELWVYDYDIRFASGSAPDPITGATGDVITVPSDLLFGADQAIYTPNAVITVLTPNILSAPSSSLAKSWQATITAVNNGADLDVPVTIKYDYTISSPNTQSFTMTYDQIITIKGTGTGDVAAATNVKPPKTRNWEKGVLPFDVTINGVAATVKSVDITANEFVKAIPKDTLNNVWQVTKGDTTQDITVPVEFVVVANAGVHDVTFKQTVNFTIVKDDGSEFWIIPSSYNVDYDGLVAVKNNNTNNLCNVQVYAYYRGDRVPTTATFSGLNAPLFNSMSSTLANDNRWIYYFKHTNNYVQFHTLSIKLKYGTDAEVVGKNTATLNIPVFYYSTTQGGPLITVVSSPKTFIGKYGDKFIHNLNVADRGNPVNLAAADTYLSYTAGGGVLGPMTVVDPRHIQHVFKQDVQDETQTTVTVRVQSSGTVGVNASVTLTFIQQPLIPKLPLAVSKTADIVGKLNDTGSVPMTITYGEDIVPSDDAKIEITADTGIEVTKTADGFDYKIILANTNPTGTYNANVTVTYEYAPGMKTSTTFVQPIKFTTSARDLVLTDAPISVKVWDIGTAAPFTLKAGNEDVTNLITDLKVTANTYVIQKASSVWQIVANAAISSIQVLTEFTYRLSDEALVRTGSGTFIIADYDGYFFTPYFDAAGSGAKDGYLMIPNALAAGGTNPNIAAKMVGIARGEKAIIEWQSHSTSGGLIATTQPTERDYIISFILKSNVVGGFGGGKLSATLKRTASTNTNYGDAYYNVVVPYIVYDSSKAAYVIGDMTKTLSGTYGDEFDVKCVVVNSGDIVDLSDPNVVIETTGGRVEVIPGSVTKKGFKLRFIGQITGDTTADQTVRIRNSATPSLDTTGKISITQIGVAQDTLTVEGLPEETTGGTNDTFTLTPTITFNGSVIPVNDPDLTISVTPDMGLEIVNITDTGIEIKVIETADTATDFIAQLTVSKGSAQAVAPWLHHYTVQPYEISVTKDTSILIPAENNLVLFTLKDNKGNPITDATKVSMDIVENPKYRFVLAGYSNTLTNNSATNPGQYRLSMNLGETAGTFTISLTVAVPGKTDSYVLEDMVFTNPGSPVVVNVDPDTIPAVESKETAVNVTLTRSQYLKPNAPAVGMLEVIRVTGAVMGATTDLDVSQDGNYSLRVISDGTEGVITIEANYTPVVNDVNWSPIPVTITLNAVKPVIDLDPMGTTNELTMNLWENKDFGFKVVSGDEDISSTVTEVTVPNSDIAGKFELIHDEQSGVYSFKAISSSNESEIVVYTIVTIKGVSDGQSYSLEQALQLTTRINDGSIPVNRFNIDFV